MGRHRARHARLGLVHDDLAQGVELAGRLHRLGEEVGEVVRRADEGHLELERLDHVPHEEVPSLHVLHAVVVLRVVRDVARALRVGREGRRSGLGLAEAARKLAQVDHVLGRLGECDDLRLAASARRRARQGT